MRDNKLQSQSASVHHRKPPDVRLCEIKSQERKDRRGCSPCLSHRTRELLRHIILASQTYRFSTGYFRDKGGGKLHLACDDSLFRKRTWEKEYEEREAGGLGGDKNNTLGATNPFVPSPLLSSFSRFSSLSSFDTQESGSSHHAFLSSEFHPLSGFLLGCAIPLYPLISGPAPTFN